MPNGPLFRAEEFYEQTRTLSDSRSELRKFPNHFPHPFWEASYVVNPTQNLDVGRRDSRDARGRRLLQPLPQQRLPRACLPARLRTRVQHGMQHRLRLRLLWLAVWVDVPPL